MSIEQEKRQVLHCHVQKWKQRICRGLWRGLQQGETDVQMRQRVQGVRQRVPLAVRR